MNNACPNCTLHRECSKQFGILLLIERWSGLHSTTQLSANNRFSVNAASVAQNAGDVQGCGRNPQGTSTAIPLPQSGSSNAQSASPPPTQT
ncbi:unnamed protein product [Nezara viridula]|uniref:Uncharacterized protein n=1 Tax=Nezara viridula TaxID=85310 RepID=A0A9P0MZH7_NEZVI|nr:unnamed protein product [Nezara viridula]